jgi:hypothetical protein
LVSNNGRLVTRGVFIQKVWNNYGGADEGLSQGISFLRKILMDSGKKVISTIPKSGYMLNCMITFPDAVIQTGPIQNKYVVKKRQFALMLVGLIILVAGALWEGVVINNKYESGTRQVVSVLATEPAVKPSSKGYAVSYPLMNEHDLDNASNSVRTTDRKGNQYLLEVYGDQRPRLYINDKLIDNQQPYTNLINHLEKILWNRGKKKS